MMNRIEVGTQSNNATEKEQKATEGFNERTRDHHYKTHQMVTKLKTLGENGQERFRR